MATVESPPEQAVSGGPVWGCNQHGEEVQIPVLGVTGKYQSGKTLFICSIAPGAERTRLYDLELSASGYWRGLGLSYVDVPGELRKIFTNDKGQSLEYQPIDVFRYFYKSIQAIQPGQFDVIAVDPITDIESGLVDHVASEYSKYGFQSKEKFMATGGIFWSRVREFWKRVLADLASRCQTFAFTAHLRKEWVGGKATSKEKPGGKTTLMELASLYLWLERMPDGQGRVAAKPRCKLKLKDRVDYTSFDPDTLEPIIIPYLPPAFDACTPGMIRDYVSSPANYNKLKMTERIKKDETDEMEKLELERDIAEAKAQAEESALQRLQRQQELREIHKQAEVEKPANSDQSGQVKVDETVKAAREEAEGNEEPPFEPNEGAISVEKATPEQAAKLVELSKKLGLIHERFQAGIARHAGGSANPLDLTREKADALIAQFTEAVERRQ